MSQSDDVPLQVKGKGRSNQSSVSDGKSEQSNQELLVEEIPPHIQDLLPDLKNSPLELADPPEPPDPHKVVAASAPQTPPSTHAGGQDDVSSNKLPQMIFHLPHSTTRGAPMGNWGYPRGNICKILKSPMVLRTHIHHHAWG